MFKNMIQSLVSAFKGSRERKANKSTLINESDLETALKRLEQKIINEEDDGK